MIISASVSGCMPSPCYPCDLISLSFKMCTCFVNMLHSGCAVSDLTKSSNKCCYTASKKKETPQTTPDIN
eukprot:574098-Pelagomonas_calceolata.AAC.1